MRRANRSRRSWKGNKEVHFRWESPMTALYLLGVLGFVVLVIR